MGGRVKTGKSGRRGRHERLKERGNGAKHARIRGGRLVVWSWRISRWSVRLPMEGGCPHPLFCGNSVYAPCGGAPRLHQSYRQLRDAPLGRRSRLGQTVRCGVKSPLAWRSRPPISARGKRDGRFPKHPPPRVHFPPRGDVRLYPAVSPPPAPPGIAYVLSIPSRNAVCACQPSAVSRETSISLRGVPSGFVASLPRCVHRSRPRWRPFR